MINKKCIVEMFSSVPYWFFVSRRKGYEIGLKEYMPLNADMEVMLIVQGETIDNLECTIIDACGILQKFPYDADLDQFGILKEYDPVLEILLKEKVENDN